MDEPTGACGTLELLVPGLRSEQVSLGLEDLGTAYHAGEAIEEQRR